MVAICAALGMRYVVLSPGSRCAPLVIAFHNHPDITCLSIIDERAAAFFAMGMAQQLGQPVGLVCTSGSATLNYAPAIAEAFYSKIPLLLFTADRPSEWIGQADGQAIQQHDIYRNYIKKSFELPSAIKDDDLLWYSNRMVSEAYNTCLIPDKGPVHINVPFREPLYELREYATYQPPRAIGSTPIESTLPENEQRRLLKSWNNYSRIMVVAGSFSPDQQLSETVNALADQPGIVVLTEVTANLNGPKLITTLDPALEAIPTNDKELYRPDLLITFGGPVVSKKLKRFLRQHQPKEHWYVDESGDHTDTYQTLTNIIRVQAGHFLKLMLEQGQPSGNGYANLWQQAQTKATQRHQQQLEAAPYCDLTVFDKVLQALPVGTNLQLANSTPIRYAGLFKLPVDKHITVNCNRGTSGIDGCISTAAGAAYISQKPTTIVAGDLSFFYDSNALWNKHLPANLRIIVINNGGGNIFRIIKGPSSLPEEVLESYFETQHNASVLYMAQAFDIPYYLCQSLEEMEANLPQFYQPNQEKAVIMEVRTPNGISANILKRYLNI